MLTKVVTSAFLSTFRIFMDISFVGCHWRRWLCRQCRCSHWCRRTSHQRVTKRKVAAIYLNLVSVFEWNVIKIWICVTKNGRQRHQRAQKQWFNVFAQVLSNWNKRTHRFAMFVDVYFPLQLKVPERWPHMSNGRGAANEKNQRECWTRTKYFGGENRRQMRAITLHALDEFKHVQKNAFKSEPKPKVTVSSSILCRKDEEKLRHACNGTARLSEWERAAQFECQFPLLKCTKRTKRRDQFFLC